MEPLPTQTLGQRIRDLRLKADLSLRDLGEKLKEPGQPPGQPPVSAAFLSDIENGRRFPSDEMVGRLARILGADAEDLRRSDPRGPAREIQDLATMNAQYAFAFRRAVDFVQDQRMTPQEFVRRVESPEFSRAATLLEQILARPLSPEEVGHVLASLDELRASKAAAPQPKPHSSSDSDAP